MDEFALLPPDLQAQATILAGEAAWPVESARSVIEFCRQHEIAVVGVEEWVPVGDNPRVLGWSGYNIRFAGDWTAYVEENARHALEEIKWAQAAGGLPADVVFNLCLIPRGER